MIYLDLNQPCFSLKLLRKNLTTIFKMHQPTPHEKLPEKTIECKNFESTKAAIQSLLSEHQLIIEAEVGKLVDFKAKLKSSTKNITISQKK